MKGLYEEILQVPQRAKDCLAVNNGLKLPKNVPYLGMGSSYYAPMTLFYCGADIQPQIASEYYYYLAGGEPLGVLISQSGESSETVWNLDNFKQVISITNKPKSSLAKALNVKQLVELNSGEEIFSSTKSYVNTLLALYLGLGFNPRPAVENLEKEFKKIESKAKSDALQVAGYIGSHKVKGLCVIGSGPNYGTASEGALTLSETTKLTWAAMSVAQYDHGPKETANETVVIILNSFGKDTKRINSIKSKLRSQSNSLVLELTCDEAEEFSPLRLITHLNFLMNYLADELKAGDTFELGGKVTTVEDSAR